MADQVTVTNLPNPGSHEAVALELWKVLRTPGQPPEQQLQFFVACRAATYGKAPAG